MLEQEQYERIARWLDGENVKLTPAEMQAAEEIRRDESRLSAMLQTAAPAASRDRARRRLVAAAARPRVTWWHAGAAAAAAAAVVLVALAVWKTRPGPERIVQPPPAAQPAPEQLDLHAYVALRSADETDEIDILTYECEDIAAEMAWAAVPSHLEFRIEALEESFEEIYIYDLPIFPTEG